MGIARSTFYEDRNPRPTVKSAARPIAVRPKGPTPDRRPKLTPVGDARADGSARPGGAGRGCAAGASAGR